MLRSQQEQEWQPTRDIVFFDIRNHVSNCILTVLSVYELKPSSYFTKIEGDVFQHRPDIEIWSELLDSIRNSETLSADTDKLEKVSISLSQLEKKTEEIISKYKGILKPAEMLRLLQSETVINLHKTRIGPVIYYRKEKYKPGLTGATLLGFKSGSEERLKESTIFTVEYFIETFRQFGGHDNYSIFSNTV